MRTHILTLSLLVLPLSTASAGTLHVPQDHPTIQAAVVAAQPGDRIKIANGVFRERILVPPAKAGLILEGSGKTVIDGNLPQGLQLGPVIRMFGADMKVKNLTVRLARDGAEDGDGIRIVGDRARVEDVKSLGNEWHGVRVDGNQARIEDCTFKGGNFGVGVYGDDASVVGCLVVGAESTSAYVWGDRARIRDCDARRTGDGFEIQGNEGRITGCKMEQTTYGVSVDGNANQVKKCEIDGYEQAGIKVKGSGNDVFDNEIRRSHAYGEPAIEFRNATSGRIEGNELSDILGAGIVVYGNGVLVKENRLKRCGSYVVSTEDPDYAAIGIAGDSNEVIDNVVQLAIAVGIEVSGAGNLVAGNSAKKSGSDGIRVVEGLGNRLIDNDVLKSQAEGIENRGTQTVVVGNRSLKNRLDIANGGTLNTFQDNDYLTGGQQTQPDVD